MIDILYAFLRRLFITCRSFLKKRRLRNKAIKKGREYHLENKDFIYRSNNMKAIFYLPLYESEYIQQKILVEDSYYEQALLDYVTKVVNRGAIGDSIKNHTVLDIGSNIGNHTLYFLHECEAAKVYCFEPIKPVFDILKKNIEVNSMTNKVIMHQVGCGEKRAYANIVHIDNQNMGSTEIEYCHKDGTIPIISIDEMEIKEPVSLVKIDVEGFEYEVIKGMKNLIQLQKPYLMIEIRKQYFDVINNDLASMDYWYINIDKKLNYLFLPCKEV